MIVVNKKRKNNRIDIQREQFLLVMFKWSLVRNGKFQHMSTIRFNYIDYYLSNLTHPEMKRRS